MKRMAKMGEEYDSAHMIASLIGMRGIACLFIVCYHYYCLFLDDQGWALEAVPWMMRSRYLIVYSNVAVELFFMMAGFLTALHYRESLSEMSFGKYFQKHYGKLIGASVVVTCWALLNTMLRYKVGCTVGLHEPTPLRFILSVLMVNTGWFTS